jgi:DNA processing protein
LTNELLYQIALGFVPGIGPVLGKQLIQTIGSASDVMRAKQSTLQKIDGMGAIRAKAIADFEHFAWIEDEIKFIEKHQIQPLFFMDDAYPYRLKQCIDSPIILYYKGNANLNSTRIISIVGRRKNTEYL